MLETYVYVYTREGLEMIRHHETNGAIHSIVLSRTEHFSAISLEEDLYSFF